VKTDLYSRSRENTGSACSIKDCHLRRWGKRANQHPLRKREIVHVTRTCDCPGLVRDHPRLHACMRNPGQRLFSSRNLATPRIYPRTSLVLSPSQPRPNTTYHNSEQGQTCFQLTQDRSSSTTPSVCPSSIDLIPTSTMAGECMLHDLMASRPVCLAVRCTSYRHRAEMGKRNGPRRYFADASPFYPGNDRTLLSIAGEDFCIVAADTRQSEGYSINSRYVPKSVKL